MWKYNRIPITLNWTINSVDLKGKFQGDYEVCFVRGKNKGSTKNLPLKKSPVINYDAEFQTPCTMFVSKTDDTEFRQKIILIRLIRHRKDEEEPKIFGQLKLDISPYFNKGCQTITTEMDTGHLNPPTITLTLFTDQPKHENENPNPSDDSLPLIAEPSNDEVHSEENEAEEDANTTPEADNDEQTSNEEEDIQSPPEIPIKAEIVQDEPKPENTKPELWDESLLFRPKDQIRHSAPPPVELTPAETLEKILTTDWSDLDNPIYFDQEKKVKVPPMLYPIATAIQKFEVFDNPELYQILINNFINDKHPDDAFITSIILSFIYPDHEQQIYELVTQSAKEVMAPFLVNFEMLSNRLATAKCKTNFVVYDFCQVLQTVQANLHYTSAINYYLTRHFLSILDVRLVIKILSNSSVINYENATIWSAFVTGFEEVTHQKLEILQEVVQSILMSSALTNEDTLVEVQNAIAPHLTPKNISYILKNIKPDSMQPEKINYKVFMDHYKIINAVSYGDFATSTIDNLSICNEGLDVSVWESAKPQYVSDPALSFLC